MSSKKHKKHESESSSDSSNSDTDSSNNEKKHENKKALKKIRDNSEENSKVRTLKSKRKSDSEESDGNERRKKKRELNEKHDDRHRDKYDRNRRDYNRRHERNDYRDERNDYRDERNDYKDERNDYRDERSDYRDRRNYRNERYESQDYRNRERRDDRESRNRRYNYRDNRRRSGSYDHANAKWGKSDDSKPDRKPPGEKQKPNFGLSGKLTEETNTYRGVVIKYSEPPEARKPRRRWRLYPFKGEKALQTLYIHRESAYLIGRDRKVVDLPIDHPSCSKQHAALQYRLVPFTREDGSAGKRVRPYLIDLESANGTFINDKKIESKKYVELLEKDVIKFGFSSREYVLLHENSKDEAMDDDVKQEENDVPVKVEPKDE